MQYIKIISHDQALLIDRIYKMLLIMSALCLIAGVDYITNPTSFTIITAIAGFVVQFACLKFWADVIMLRKPWKNCWEFKEK